MIFTSKIFQFFSLMLLILLIATFFASFHFDKEILHFAEDTSQFMEKWWIFFIQLTFNFVFMWLLFVFFDLCDELHEGYGSGTAFLLAILWGGLTPLIAIFCIKGLWLFHSVFHSPLLYTAIIFLINVFILVPKIRFSITGIFVLDLIILGSIFSIFSLLFTVGFLSCYKSGFCWGWPWIISATAVSMLSGRLFLWKYEDL